MSLLLGLSDETYERIGECAFIIRGFATPHVPALINELRLIANTSPFRHMVTPNGLSMSVALTNCGSLGWVSDKRGYRYSAIDPQTQEPWPEMPTLFKKLASLSTETVGLGTFEPDACLINRYVPGSRMSLHQDKDEHDLSFHIVSISLGMPATFLFGGNQRTDKILKTSLFHGDVLIWGGVDRLRYHGINPLNDDPHPLLGSQRINLTFRKAG